MEEEGGGWVLRIKKRLRRTRSLAPPVFALVLSAALLSSCLTIGKKQTAVEGDVQTDKVAEGLIGQSDAFILHQVQPGDTPARLAERYLGDRDAAWRIEDANEEADFVTQEVVVIPLKDENKAGLSMEGYQMVPILCYHRFTESCKSSMCLPPSVFERQMAYLKNNGYRVITLHDLYDFLNYRRGIPKKSVIITLDDGYRSAYEVAYPILKKYGFTATLFIYTDFVGASKNAVNWEQLGEMRNAGFEVGSHSISHCDLTKKREGEGEAAYVERITREIVRSKQIIDEKLSQTTVSIAFPYGIYNQKILTLCDQAGYTMAFSVKRGGNAFFADPLQLKRTQVLKKDMDAFISSLKSFQNAPLR
jgi:peptidoglycan/xylan/chitin deacetylase (PgdA/CDA1 family)